jgi:hypothetical protein
MRTTIVLRRKKTRRQMGAKATMTARRKTTLIEPLIRRETISSLGRESGVLYRPSQDRSAK